MAAFVSRSLAPPKLTSWSNWDEWLNTYLLVSAALAALESHRSRDNASLRAASGALRVWVQRGRAPLAVFATQQLLSILEADAEFLLNRNDIETSADYIRLSYSMALVRLVNGMADSGQRGVYAQSVMDAARRLGLPRSLVDLRHESTHGALPSLPLLRAACRDALVWLRDAYWDRQWRHLNSKLLLAPAASPTAPCAEGCSLSAPPPAIHEALLQFAASCTKLARLRAYSESEKRDDKRGAVPSSFVVVSSRGAVKGGEVTRSAAAAAAAATKNVFQKKRRRHDTQQQHNSSETAPSSERAADSPESCVHGFLVDVQRALEAPQAVLECNAASPAFDKRVLRASRDAMEAIATPDAAPFWQPFAPSADLGVDTAQPFMNRIPSSFSTSTASGRASQLVDLKGRCLSFILAAAEQRRRLELDQGAAWLRSLVSNYLVGGAALLLTPRKWLVQASAAATRDAVVLAEVEATATAEVDAAAATTAEAAATTLAAAAAEADYPWMVEWSSLLLRLWRVFPCLPSLLTASLVSVVERDCVNHTAAPGSQTQPLSHAQTWSLSHTQLQSAAAVAHSYLSPRASATPTAAIEHVCDAKTRAIDAGDGSGTSAVLWMRFLCSRAWFSHRHWPVCVRVCIMKRGGSSSSAVTASSPSSSPLTSVQPTAASSVETEASSGSTAHRRAPHSHRRLVAEVLRNDEPLNGAVVDGSGIGGRFESSLSPVQSAFLREIAPPWCLAGMSAPPGQLQLGMSETAGSAGGGSGRPFSRLAAASTSTPSSSHRGSSKKRRTGGDAAARSARAAVSVDVDTSLLLALWEGLGRVCAASSASRDSAVYAAFVELCRDAGLSVGIAQLHSQHIGNPAAHPPVADASSDASVTVPAAFSASGASSSGEQLDGYEGVERALSSPISESLCESEQPLQTGVSVSTDQSADLSLDDFETLLGGIVNSTVSTTAAAATIPWDTEERITAADASVAYDPLPRWRATPHWW